MAEISNIGPGNDNNFNGTNSSARRDSTEKRTSAFDDYKNFQQKKLKEYQNFRDKKLKEYENFKNQKLKEYEEHKNSVLNNDSSNLIGADKAEDDKGAQIPQKIEYPKMDKPDTPPVKIQEQDTADEPANVKNPDNNQKIPDKTVSKNKQQIPFSTVEREGVIGKYKITAGENGDGFLLATEMNVFGGGEASKFFKPGGFFDDKIKYDEGTKQYSFRGIKANSRFMLQMTIQ